MFAKTRAACNYAEYLSTPMARVSTEAMCISGMVARRTDRTANDECLPFLCLYAMTNFALASGLFLSGEKEKTAQNARARKNSAAFLQPSVIHENNFATSVFFLMTIQHAE